jgi:GTPase SAR1 family protein
MLTEDSDRVPVIKIITLGDSGVGKSTLIHRFKNLPADEHTRCEPTIGVDLVAWRIDVPSPVWIQVWDTAGDERFRSVTQSYYRGTDAILLLYDMSYKPSFESIVAHWWDDIQTYCGHVTDARNGSDRLRPAILLLGNKRDRYARQEQGLPVDALDAELERRMPGLVAVPPSRRAHANVDRARVKQFVAEHGQEIIRHAECSATHWSVERDQTVFDDFLAEVLRRIPPEQRQYRETRTGSGGTNKLRVPGVTEKETKKDTSCYCG